MGCEVKTKANPWWWENIIVTDENKMFHSEYLRFKETYGIYDWFHEVPFIAEQLVGMRWEAEDEI